MTETLKPASGDTVVAGLSLGTWTRANRELIAKLVTEFSYEEIITPRFTTDGTLRWELPTGVLTGRAVWRPPGWWRVVPESLDWQPGPFPDAAELLAVALRDIDPSTVANLVAELSSTVLTDARQLARARPAAELVDLDPVLVETELRGHPWIVANKGRVGFDIDDLLAYPPEAGREVRLRWLAADPSVADTASVAGLDHHTVVREQIGAASYARLQAKAQLAGLDPDGCVYLPVHPWQWTNRILPLYAGEIARGMLVSLGEGPARYRPQLSIRTLTDLGYPERRYLKLPVSILNTSVYRGLPRERTLAAPALTSWLAGIVASDAFLSETGLILLGEVAAVSVAHPTYEALPGVPYQHTEMLGAIWREPVQPHLRPGEQAISLAALLHVDPDGATVTEALIKRSGLSPVQWLQHLNEAVLPPLLHMLYRYGTMFTPHGQNCMIVHRSGTPTRLVVKDFVDDLAISSEPLPEHANLPAEVRSALADVTLNPKNLTTYLHSGLLICVYRYLDEIITDRFGIPEGTFWATARATLHTYQHQFATELSDRYARYDLQTPTFPKLCLNRLRIVDGYHDHQIRPGFPAVGTIPNPLVHHMDARSL